MQPSLPVFAAADGECHSRRPPVDLPVVPLNIPSGENAMSGRPMDARYPTRQSRYLATNSAVGSLGIEGATYVGDVSLERVNVCCGACGAPHRDDERDRKASWTELEHGNELVDSARAYAAEQRPDLTRGRPALTWQASGRLFLVDTAWADAAASPLAYP